MIRFPTAATLCVLAALAVLPALPSFADEIVFKNGDHLTGTIKTADGGKLTIDTSVAGTVTVNISDVKTFSTQEPITIKLQDGSIIKDKVVPAPEGQIATAGTGVVKPQPIALTAIQKVNPPPVKWTGAVTAGGLLTRGNSDTDNFNIGIDAVRRTEKDRITGGAGYFFGRQRDPATGDKVTTTDNWFLLGKYDYFFTEKFYGYGLTKVEKDRIAELDLRVSPGVGVGYQWVEKPDFNFSTEAGVSYVFESFHNDGSDEHVAGRLAYHVDKKINDKVTLFHNAEYLPSFEDVSDYNLSMDAGIRASLTTTMFTEFKAEWKYDSTPAPGAEHNDLRYLLSVGWTF
jgi:putative salt-induced outer membrane protein YdiY